MQHDIPRTESADPSAGIVWAFRFTPRGDPKPLTSDAVAGSLVAENGWTWVHLKLGDVRCRQWTAQRAPISEWAREVLLGPDEHLYLDHSGNELIGILPDLQLEFARATEEIARLRFVMNDRLLVTIRRSPLRSVELARKSAEDGMRFPSPTSLLDALLDNFAGAVRKHVLALRDELDQIEDLVLGETMGRERQRLGRVRIQVVRMHRQLSQLRTLLHRLEPRLAQARNPLAGVVTNLAQKFDEIDADAAGVNERARLLQDEVAAKLNELAGRRLFALSLMTAALLPPTLVTGIFGMNTKDLPFQETTGGTYLALLIAAAAGAVTFWALQRLRVI
jgi:zinc transporter